MRYVLIVDNKRELEAHNKEVLIKIVDETSLRIDLFPKTWREFMQVFDCDEQKVIYDSQDCVEKTIKKSQQRVLQRFTAYKEFYSI